MKDKIKSEKKLLNILAEIYFLIIILLYPLVVDKTGFFHILEFKWHFYLSISVIYILLNILVITYSFFFNNINIFKYVDIKKSHYFLFIFLIINVISYFLSPFKEYDLLVGVGRGEGLIMVSLYVLTFIFVSLFIEFKKRHIMYFTISSILLNIIAVLQYIGFNPFNMYQNGIGTHNVSFMITIGNVDFISALYCILLSVSFYSFIFLKEKKWEKILHLISVYLGFFIIGIIDVQSGKLAFILTLIIVFPYIISNNKRLSRFVILISSILFSYCTNIIINPEYHYTYNKLGLYFQFNINVLLYLCVIFTLVYLSFLIKKLYFDFTNNKKIIKNVYLFMLFALFLVLVFIYFYNFKSGFLYEIHELMHFNFDDNFGTYRIFLWKRTMRLIKDYPLLGTGPDTFAIRFMAKYTIDIAKIGPLTLNDTAANVYLTMLINIGILGLFSYVAFIFYRVKESIKSKSIYSKVLLIAIICFLIQDFFNLWVVIVTPIYFMLLALCQNEK